MRVTFFLLLLFLSVTSCFAKNFYFDFEIPGKLFIPNDEINLKFISSLKGAKEEDFLVFPLSPDSNIKIYNPEKEIWIGANSVRSAFPKLEETMKIKIGSFNGISSEICFDLQLIKSAKIYSTPCKTYWNRNHFIKYINLVNDRIFKWLKEGLKD